MTTVETSWLQLSVDEFFSHCNWSGESLALLDWQPESGQPLPLTVLVAEFFRALPWEGKPAVGAKPKSASPEQVSAPEEPRETTLADLVDLF